MGINGVLVLETPEKLRKTYIKWNINNLLVLLNRVPLRNRMQIVQEFTGESKVVGESQGQIQGFRNAV